MNYIDTKTERERYRVNVLHQGKERWKYCRTIKKARQLQEGASLNAIHSIICKKVNGKYIAI